MFDYSIPSRGRPPTSSTKLMFFTIPLIAALFKLDTSVMCKASSAFLIQQTRGHSSIGSGKEDRSLTSKVETSLQKLRQRQERISFHERNERTLTLNALMDDFGRRRFIQCSTASLFTTVMAPTATLPGKSVAAMVDDGNSNSLTGANIDMKPVAPLETLLPATRVRLYINHVVSICQTLVSNQKGSNDDVVTIKLTESEQSTLVNELKELLLSSVSRPLFFRTREEKVSSKKYLQVNTWSSWSKVQREKGVRAQQDPFQDTSSGVSLFIMDPAGTVNTAFEQWGERRQWKILRRRQAALERSNEMRAAFNAYTNNLVFGDDYQWTGTKEEKKLRIRNDALPDTTSVIRSDLDLRDLYRNQVLTAIDDAKAELEFQMSLPSSDFSELLTLLKEAQTSCDEWFKFIPEKDVSSAAVAVGVE